MARRTLNVGVDPEHISKIGIPPPYWDQSSWMTSGYVGGCWSDEGPLTALLWADLRRAYRVMRISHQDATIFELKLAGVSLRRIAESFGVAPNTVKKRVLATEQKLNMCPTLGLLTVIVEECGGWAAAAEMMF